ncbi:hypothetical protein AB0N33_16285 [Pseudarthrobacter oxydans]|uniref:AbiJ-NTD3 domain-containing protein n=2 Tax=unclassified Arthrobacter TaxID=235627 RepID=I3W1G1_9MICC|nr:MULTISPECIES: hypothetical protein [unclassified Arthrobacter]AFK89438.1 hypothetical protein [Arthrobacter sp. J3.40]AFK89583.1 hypothetical protein [Arthrobacter sp. J3.53]
MSGFNSFAEILTGAPRLPVKVSSRSFRSAVEEAFIQTYTRQDLQSVLAEELKLSWPKTDHQPADTGYTKRDIIKGYTEGWDLPRLVALARRMVTELEVNDMLLADLTALLAEYDRGGGVGTPAKNLIFAANGPKPELVLRDALNNDIEITRNGEYCLVYDLPIPADGLTYSNLIEWWRERQGFADDVPPRDVGLDLHNRLRASLDDNPVELRVFDAYAARYKDHGFAIPALIPQVYLHFDPASQLSRRSAGQNGSPLARQRMDFLILFSSRHRVVLEVDGKQHYANGDTASPALYSDMVAEDRRLRLAGYEVYRFGGAELMKDDADRMVAEFFDQLAERMR